MHNIVYNICYIQWSFYPERLVCGGSTLEVIQSRRPDSEWLSLKVNHQASLGSSTLRIRFLTDGWPSGTFSYLHKRYWSSAGVGTGGYRPHLQAGTFSPDYPVWSESQCWEGLGDFRRLKAAVLWETREGKDLSFHTVPLSSEGKQGARTSWRGSKDKEEIHLSLFFSFSEKKK